MVIVKLDTAMSRTMAIGLLDILEYWTEELSGNQVTAMCVADNW